MHFIYEFHGFQTLHAYQSIPMSIAMVDKCQAYTKHEYVYYMRHK